jgi:hypothetical protein
VGKAKPDDVDAVSAQPSSTVKRRWFALVLLVGVAMLVFFGLRAWRQMDFAQRVESGAVQVETLRGWMTLSYIERVYGVPEAEQRAALGLPATGFEDRSLREWLDSQGQDAEAGRRVVEALILQRRPAADRP